MSDEDDFTPRLGKPRNAGGRKARTYLQRVLQARTLAGGARRITRAFTGSRIARGNVAGRQLASRDRFDTWRHRRVTVKARIVRFDKAKEPGAARAHLRYTPRAGVHPPRDRRHPYSAHTETRRAK